MLDLTVEKALIFRITHISNVPWLLENGVHCPNSDIRDPNFRRIGNLDLIAKRVYRAVSRPPGGTLSDYVPFYFTPCSPMLYNIKTGYQGVEKLPMADIVVLVSSLHRIRELGIDFVFTDRHAYLMAAQYSSDLDELNVLDWPRLRARDFKKKLDEPDKDGKVSSGGADSSAPPGEWNRRVGVLWGGTTRKPAGHHHTTGASNAGRSKTCLVPVMISYTKGNLLEARTEAVVNTVNEVGVMGKGIALMFREAFPESAKTYEQAAKRGSVHIGEVLVTENKELFGPRWIIHFPTKKHWRRPSKIEWIRRGLVDLKRVIHDYRIRSIALPPLGCGNGRLQWHDVRREIEVALTELKDLEVVVYEPTAEYVNEPKRRGVEELPPARALIAELVRRYSVLGIDCTNLEVHKLAWFLQRMIGALRLPDPLDLRFGANRYGPYADRLRHLLDALDGSYLHCEKRLSDAGPLEPIWFDDSKRQAVAEYLYSDAAEPYLRALDATTKIIDGFESPLGMELLATVDWLLHERNVESTVPAIKLALKSWPGGPVAVRRKLRLLDDRMLDLAIARLRTPGNGG